MIATALPMPIKCVAAFAGGKRGLARRVVELLGPHDTYVEPFVGGCSILPAKARSAEEVVNDATPAVASVLRVMGGYPESLAHALAKVEFDRAAFDFARGYSACAFAADVTRHSATLDAQAAAQQLAVWWQGPGGLAGTSRRPWFAARKTKTGGDPAVRWNNFKASLPALCERMSGVLIYNQSWQQLFHSYRPDAAGVAYYCDPPYLVKSFRYAHDFNGYDEHLELAAALNGLARARVVVSYYDDGLGTLARLYPPERWRRIDVEMSKNMSAAAGKTGRATEVLLVNDGGGR